MVRNRVVSYKVAQALVLVVSYKPPRFKDIVKAIENKGRDGQTEIVN